MSPPVASGEIARLARHIPKAEEYARQLQPGPARELSWNYLGRIAPQPAGVEPGPDRAAMLKGMAQRQIQNAVKSGR